MKFRQLIVSAAFLLFCAAPWSLAQTTDTSPKDPTANSGQGAPADQKPSAQSSQSDQTSTNDNTQMPPAVPPKDDSTRKRDGGRSAVTAIETRKPGGRGRATGTPWKARFAWANSTLSRWKPA